MALAAQQAPHGGHLVARALAIAAVLLCAATLPASGLTAQPPTYVGSLVGSDALENFPIGGPQAGVFAYRFRAQWTGTVNAVRFFAILNTERSGYSGGTGGVFHVALYASATGGRHVPGGSPLTSADYLPTKADLYPRLRFPSPARVQLGHYYYVVFTNGDPAPTENYASVNTLYLDRPAGAQAPPLPAGLSVLWSYGVHAGAAIYWQAHAASGSEYVPIVDVSGGRAGQHTGLGYMESWSNAPEPIGGAARVRERFAFKRTHAARVVSASVRLRRTAGSAPLLVSLETMSGRVIATGSAPAARVPSSVPGWVDVTFAAPPLLHPGASLALVLGAADSASYEAYPVRDGTMFGFGNATVFSSGYAQFDDGSGWVGWTQWDQPNRHDGDLQFALRLAG